MPTNNIFSKLFCFLLSEGTQCCRSGQWSVDPDLDPNSESGSRRAGGFSCSLNVLYGGLWISKLQFLIKKITNFFLAVNIWSSKPWIRICIQPKISVADPGCLSWIPDPKVFNPGSRICNKEFKYFNPKNLFLSSRKYDPGCLY